MPFTLSNIINLCVKIESVEYISYWTQICNTIKNITQSGGLQIWYLGRFWTFNNLLSNPQVPFKAFYGISKLPDREQRVYKLLYIIEIEINGVSHRKLVYLQTLLKIARSAVGSAGLKDA